MKTKKSLLNFLTDVIPLLIVSFLGIFKLKFFVQYLGDDTLGLYQLFSQIMVYISLVDGGLTSAVLYSLYNVHFKKHNIVHGIIKRLCEPRLSPFMVKFCKIHCVLFTSW